MVNNGFFKEVRGYVFKLFKSNLPSAVVYHNFDHTVEVVNAAFEIGTAENISDEEMKTLLIAAWFHDTGNIKSYLNHEEESKKIVSNFLKDKGFEKDQISTISGLIDATKMPQKPKNKLERIICDSDLVHLGKKDFKEKSELLKLEWELLGYKNSSEFDWCFENENFLTTHSFFTDYAYENFNSQKTKNLLKLKKDLKKMKDGSEKKLKNKSTKKEMNPEKGIETMFRVTLRNHINLSAIADTKSNILLSVSAIMMSIVLTTLVPKLDKPDNYYLIYPTAIFLFITVVTIIFSILATRPKVTSGNFTKEDIANKKVNLLFFGNFYKMSLEEFQEGIFEVMGDYNYLYKSLMKDLYFLGIVLQKKYKLLRIAYTIFMIGIVISVIAFVISFSLMRVETGAI
ncbi:MAG: HD domain-containing protein [Bacteroidetes bacterium]|nr:HD domain-containing protein [Bacteroidota bacterium]